MASQDSIIRTLMLNCELLIIQHPKTSITVTKSFTAQEGSHSNVLSDEDGATSSSLVLMSGLISFGETEI